MLFHFSKIPSEILHLTVWAFTCFSTGKGITSLLEWGVISNNWHRFQRVNDIIFIPRREETKKHHLFVDTSEDFWHPHFFFFLWHVQYVSKSYKYLISHIFKKRHAKHKTSKFLEGSEILGVLQFRASAAAGTCAVRVLLTPAGLWIPSGPIILVCLLFLTTSSV